MMNSMEEIIGYHCAPAIRGIKVANLVAIPRSLDAQITNTLRTLNEECNGKGLFFYELCHCQERRLLLVFRKNMLKSYLRQPDVVAFLNTYGYKTEESLDTWLLRLRWRLETSTDFPHEIGVFLGYPLADVKAFIAHKGSDHLCCGEWKVYSNEVAAQRSFYCFRVCRQFCHTELEKGRSLTSLVTTTAS